MAVAGPIAFIALTAPQIARRLTRGTGPHLMLSTLTGALLLLLDEPTTFLDIAHQYDLLELCHELHREGRTIVAVLHDLNQAARFAMVIPH
ncbi:hypothetical protein GCM10022224_023480 [Nonomuraea antimicrobica]|uniref:Iron complex transport system ATP-binding protein n=1 Tax=Nonomuraea antimicrobica TaxID=561173 RepID=A0ABP7BFL0_9ACTN